MPGAVSGPAVRPNTYTYICICMYTRMYICIHIYICIHFLHAYETRTRTRICLGADSQHGAAHATAVAAAPYVLGLLPCTACIPHAPCSPARPPSMCLPRLLPISPSIPPFSSALTPASRRPPLRRVPPNQVRGAAEARPRQRGGVHHARRAHVPQGEAESLHRFSSQAYEYRGSCLSVA